MAVAIGLGLVLQRNGCIYGIIHSRHAYDGADPTLPPWLVASSEVGMKAQLQAVARLHRLPVWELCGLAGCRRATGS